MKHQGKSRVAMFAGTKEESAVGNGEIFNKNCSSFSRKQRLDCKAVTVYRLTQPEASMCGQAPLHAVR